MTAGELRQKTLNECTGTSTTKADLDRFSARYDGRVALVIDGPIVHVMRQKWLGRKLIPCAECGKRHKRNQYDETVYTWEGAVIRRKAGMLNNPVIHTPPCDVYTMLPHLSESGLGYRDVEKL